MKIFLSWSGERSKQVAFLLDEWLRCVIQAADPWLSSKDIDRGSLWFNEISEQLSSTSIGIVCLTKENLDKPWILFESGALAKGISSSRVCTFLIDLEPNDVSNPLAQFNHTVPTKDSVYALVRTVNSTLGEKSLTATVLGTVFETYWNQFESKFLQIISDTPATNRKLPVRSGDEILKEVLTTVRDMNKRLIVAEETSGVAKWKRNIDFRKAFENDTEEERRKFIFQKALDMLSDSSDFKDMIGKLPKKLNMSDKEITNLYTDCSILGIVK